MNSLGTLDLLDLLARTSNQLESQWMVAGPQPAGSTTLTVAYTNSVSVDGTPLVPTIAPSAAVLYEGARLSILSGANQGWSTTILGISSTVGSNQLATETTITVADPIPAPLTGPTDALAGLDGELLEIRTIPGASGANSTAWAINQSVSANTPILTTPWTAPADGELVMKIYLPASGTAATATVTETQDTTAETGAAASAPGLLNSGEALTPGNWYAFTLPVLGGYTYNPQISVSETVVWNAYFQR